MAGNETLVAYCGGCGRGLLTLQVEDGLWRYLCRACGYETPWQRTAEAAADDAVWAPLARSRAAAGHGRAVGGRARAGRWVGGAGGENSDITNIV